MRFTVATVLAFAGAVIAQTAGFDAIVKPGDEETLTAGTTYDIEWDYDSTHPGDITLTLLGGSSPSTLQQVQVIASDVDSSSGSLSWAIDSSLGTFATYGIQITLDSDSSVFQYSFPFKISPAAAASSSSPSSSAASTPASSVTVTSSAASSAAITTSAPSSVVVTTVIDSTVTDTTDCGSETSSVAAVTSSIGWNTTVSSSFTSVYLTTSAFSNWTSSASPNGAKTTKTAVTTIVTTPTSTPAAKTSSPAIVVTNGAFSLGANSVALIGGLLVAALAL